MRTSKRVQLPKDLTRGRSQFQTWRATRQAGSRIPQTLWALGRPTGKDAWRQSHRLGTWSGLLHPQRTGPTNG